MQNQISSLILIIIVILILLLFVYILSKFKKPKLNKAHYSKSLDAIARLLNSANYQLVVMESDKLLDSALKDLGIRGSTMGQRLKNCNNPNLNLNDAWWAHKLRNRVAHEVGYNVSESSAVRVFKILKATLKKLGAI